MIKRIGEDMMNDTTPTAKRLYKIFEKLKYGDPNRNEPKEFETILAHKKGMMIKTNLNWVEPKGHFKLSRNDTNFLKSLALRFRQNSDLNDIDEVFDGIMSDVSFWVQGGELKRIKKTFEPFDKCSKNRTLNIFESYCQFIIQAQIDRKEFEDISIDEPVDDNYNESTGQNENRTFEDKYNCSDIFKGAPTKSPEDAYIGKEIRQTIAHRPQMYWAESAKRRAFMEWENKVKIFRKKYKTFWFYLTLQPEDSQLWTFFATLIPEDFVFTWKVQYGNTPFPDENDMKLKAYLHESTQNLLSKEKKLKEAKKELKKTKYKLEKAEGFKEIKLIEEMHKLETDIKILNDEIKNLSFKDTYNSLTEYGYNKEYTTFLRNVDKFKNNYLEAVEVNGTGAIITEFKDTIINQKSKQKKTTINILTPGFSATYLQKAKARCINIMYRKHLNAIYKERSKFIKEWKQKARKGKFEIYDYEEETKLEKSVLSWTFEAEI